MKQIRFVSTLLFSLVIASTTIQAEDIEHRQGALKLPPDLLALLQAEMREITGGVQKIPVAIAQADWQTLSQTSESIRSSYIMAKALTKEQIEVLDPVCLRGSSRSIQNFTIGRGSWRTQPRPGILNSPATIIHA